MVDEASIRRYHVLGDVYLPIVAHDGVKHPEEAARSGRSIRLELHGDLTNGLDAGGPGHVARQHHVEVVEVGLLEAIPEICDLLRSKPRTLESPIPGMVTYAPMSVLRPPNIGKYEGKTY